MHTKPNRAWTPSRRGKEAKEKAAKERAKEKAREKTTKAKTKDMVVLKPDHRDHRGRRRPVSALIAEDGATSAKIATRGTIAKGCKQQPRLLHQLPRPSLLPPPFH